MKDVTDIVNNIMAGKLTRETDEAYAEGFWDLAGHIVYGIENVKDMSEATLEYLESEIYASLWEAVEATRAKTEQQ